MEARVSALEAGFARIEAKLDALPSKADLAKVDDRVAKVDDRIRKIESESLPKLATELGELKGRVSQLPTTTTIFSYMGALVMMAVGLGAALLAIIRFASP